MYRRLKPVQGIALLGHDTNCVYTGKQASFITISLKIGASKPMINFHELCHKFNKKLNGKDWKARE